MAGLTPAFAQLVVSLPEGFPATNRVESPAAAGESSSAPAEADSLFRKIHSPDRDLNQHLAASQLAALGPSSILLSGFDGTLGSGGIRTGSTWAGNVSQGAHSITVGGSAGDDNGWGVTGLSLNATGMNSIVITAQRDPGNVAGSLFIQFEDRNLNTSIFSVNTTVFGLGTPTQAQIPIGVWPAGFDFAQISGWSIGGGGLGAMDFRMTLFSVELSSVVVVPEPSTVTMMLMSTVALLATSGWRRRREKRPTNVSLS